MSRVHAQPEDLFLNYKEWTADIIAGRIIEYQQETPASSL